VGHIPRNPFEVLIEQTARGYLDAAEDVIASNRTTLVVKERMSEALVTAAYHCTKNDTKHRPFAVLWIKLKPSSPDQVREPLLVHDPRFL
jgi:hypothetical protein